MIERAYKANKFRTSSTEFNQQASSDYLDQEYDRQGPHDDQDHEPDSLPDESGLIVQVVETV